MCNRFALHSPLSLLQEEFGFTGQPDHEPRYNVAPTQRVLAVRAGAALVPEAVLMRWGTPAPWAPDGPPIINARAETAADKPAFRDALAHRRALVLADGFFEWRPEDGGRQPYYLTLSDGGPFGIGALYEEPVRPGEPATCVLLTVEANALVREIHERMPLIVPPDHRAEWLDPATSPARLAELSVPYPADHMAMRRVDRRVNDVRHEGPDLLAPPRQGSLFEM